MIRFAILALLFAAAPLFAQTKEVVEEVEAMLAQQRVALRQAEERTEDIEVLRRLLNKAFGFDHVTSQLPESIPLWQVMGSTAIPSDLTKGPWYQPPGLSPFVGQPVGVPVGKHVSQSVGPFDGVYLKGTGVVFTLRVPKDGGNAGLCVGTADTALGLGSSCNGCHHEAIPAHKDARAAGITDCQKCHSTDMSSKVAKPVSDWDRIRADVRGEKPPAVTATVADPKKPRATMCKPGDLRELLVAQLHAHAKNVRHLEKNEWVWVIVTFDEAPGAKPTRIPAPTDKPTLSPDELQSLTLGDLHLKQGKFAEAAAAYEKGLTRFRDGAVKLTFPPTIPMVEVQRAIAELEKSVRGLYKSLATAYLGADQIEKAKAALEKATAFKVELATAGPEKTKPVLPAKLVFAVAKSDIDRNPKLDEFRKGAHIELSGFPLPEKK